MEEQLAVCDIAKIDDDQQLVFGWASIIKDEEGRLLVDRQDDFIEEEGELEKAAYDYVLKSRDGGEMHIRKGVSTMVESVVLTKEKQQAMGITQDNVPVGWWIGFKVNDNRVWGEVKKGGYSGFSVHGKGKRTQKTLADGTFTDVGKNDKGKVERPTPDEEQEIKRHEERYGKPHADMMRKLITDGNTMEAAHAMANKMVVSKEDCGCDNCNGGSVLVEKRFLKLITKAQTASQNKIGTVMREFKAGKLKDKNGKKITNSRQAMAIALSEAGISKKHGMMPAMPAPYIMPKGSNFCVYDMTGKKVGEYPSIQQAKEKMTSLAGKHKGVVHRDDGRKKVNKGDYAGHPFRGNQHTGGIYHGSSGAKAGAARSGRAGSSDEGESPTFKVVTYTDGSESVAEYESLQDAEYAYRDELRRQRRALKLGRTEAANVKVELLDDLDGHTRTSENIKARTKPPRKIKTGDSNPSNLEELKREGIFVAGTDAQLKEYARQADLDIEARTTVIGGDRGGRTRAQRQASADFDRRAMQSAMARKRAQKPEAGKTLTGKFIKDLPPKERKAFVASQKKKLKAESAFKKLVARDGRKIKMDDYDPVDRSKLKTGGTRPLPNRPSDVFYSQSLRGKSGLNTLRKQKFFKEMLNASERDAFLSESKWAKDRGIAEAYLESVNTVKKKIVSKGDFAGHPFRGNQHTGGIYASAASAKQRSPRTRVRSREFENRFATPTRKRPRLKSDLKATQARYVDQRAKDVAALQEEKFITTEEIKSLPRKKVSQMAKLIRSREAAMKTLQFNSPDESRFSSNSEQMRSKRLIEKFRRERKALDESPTGLVRRGTRGFQYSPERGGDLSLDNPLKKWYGAQKKADQEMRNTWHLRDQMGFRGSDREMMPFESDARNQYKRMRTLERRGTYKDAQSGKIPRVQIRMEDKYPVIKRYVGNLVKRKR